MSSAKRSSRDPGLDNVLLDLGLGERIQIGDDSRPGARVTERGDAVLQCLLHGIYRAAGAVARDRAAPAYAKADQAALPPSERTGAPCRAGPWPWLGPSIRARKFPTC